MKRRAFLASSVGAAVWAAGRPIRTRISRARIRFGYAAITWGGNDARAIDDIATLGFRGIQLRQSAVTTWGDRPAELKQLLTDRHLTLVALSSGDVSLDPAVEQETLTQHSRHARFVRDVGGRYLQVIDQRPSGREPVPDDYRRMGRLLTEIGRRSADVGIPLGYHNHMGALGQSPAEIQRVLDAADPQYVRLLLDTAHLQRAGGDPAQAVRHHAGRLLFLHIKDLDESGRFVELGRGKVDVPGVFAALDDIGFDGWGVVELDSVTDATRTPKESGAMARRYLEAAGRWNDAS
ncbi:MAG TPA: sugar phosphate isomerase/epimerase [Gemmatimonadales bacterium]|nr:sugar phosphate isomerase/epimerase [Gemmatimonadales bacterium]